MYYDEKTAARIFIALLNAVDGNKERLKKSWIDSAGRMCVCDGFRAYRLNTPIAGVPDQEAGSAPDLDKVFPATLADYKPLNLPTLAEIKAMQEEDKRAKKRGETVSNVFTFGADENGQQLPAVNINYLADTLQIFPDVIAYYTKPTSPIVFKDKNGDAILLPIRISGGSSIDPMKRRTVTVQPKNDKVPAFGLRTFAAIYAP